MSTEEKLAYIFAHGLISQMVYDGKRIDKLDVLIGQNALGNPVLYGYGFYRKDKGIDFSMDWSLNIKAEDVTPFVYRLVDSYLNDSVPTDVELVKKYHNDLIINK